MYTDEHINYLNSYRNISTIFLQFRFHLSPENAKNILTKIVRDYANVFFITKDQIAIAEKKSNRKKVKIRKKKKINRWKDVTKP